MTCLDCYELSWLLSLVLIGTTCVDWSRVGCYHLSWLLPLVLIGVVLIATSCLDCYHFVLIGTTCLDCYHLSWLVSFLAYRLFFKVSFHTFLMYFSSSSFESNLVCFFFVVTCISCVFLVSFRLYRLQAPPFYVIFKPFWCILSRGGSNRIWCVYVCVVVTFMSCVFLSPFVCIGHILRSLSKRFWGIPSRAHLNRIGRACVCVVVMCICCVYWSPFVCIASFLRALFTHFGCIRAVGSKPTSSSFWYEHIKYRFTKLNLFDYTTYFSSIW